MENYSVVLFIMALMIALSGLATRIKLPYPVLLIIAGISLGFIPQMPVFEIDPEIVFLIFLPPLLYDAAFNISFDTLRKNFQTVSSLAFSLVFITATGIACLAYFLVQGMTWPLAFVLGAILSATDAVAATNITKGLGLSHKTITILEGESLINDASALVAYRFAVAAVAGSAFVFWKAYLQFLLVLVGGFVVGFLLGKILSVILRQVRNNFLVVISFLLLTPFITYQLAEELHVSGVIAVVTLGLVISRLSKRKFPENLKQQSQSIWEIVIFLLNGLIFILIGLEFPYVMRNIDDAHLLPFIGYSFLIAAVALVIRFLSVRVQRLSLQRGFNSKRKRVSEQALIDTKNSIIISWSGMRGIISLAVAFGLPRTLENGTPFPLRNEIIFISVVVVLITLIGQGVTLPLIIKWLYKKETHTSAETS